MTAKNYRTLAWVTVLLIFVSAFINPPELGWGLSLLALFLLAMGMRLENRNK
jgi:hypothetical protein